MHLRCVPFFALLACSSTTRVVSNDPFVGSWSCDATGTTTITQPPGVPTSPEQSTYTVTMTDDGSGNITHHRESPAGGPPPCTTHHTLNADGKSTTIEPGQACTTVTGATVTYTSGGLTLNPDGTYASRTSWDFSGTTPKGAPMVGTGSGSGICKRR
jgi:hypothetical protein